MDRVGRVRNVTIGWNRRTNQSRGYAFVEFADRRDAEAAFDKFRDYSLDGRRLRCDWDVGLDKKSRDRPRSRSPPPRRDRRSRSPRTFRPIPTVRYFLPDTPSYSSPQKP
jgi:RNA recognition motif-containing protein